MATNTTTTPYKRHLSVPAFSSASLSSNAAFTQFTIHYYSTSSPQAALADSAFGQTHHWADLPRLNGPFALTYSIPKLLRPLEVNELVTLCFIQELALEPDALPLAAMEAGKQYDLTLYWNSDILEHLDENGNWIGLATPYLDKGEVFLESLRWPCCMADGGGLFRRPGVRMLRTAEEVRMAKNGRARRMTGKVTKSIDAGVWTVAIALDDHMNQTQPRDDLSKHDEANARPRYAGLHFDIDLAAVLTTMPSPSRDKATRSRGFFDKWGAEIRERFATRWGPQVSRQPQSFRFLCSTKT